MFIRPLVAIVSALAALELAAATTCPVCPATDLVGDALVAQSGGTLGTPKFCGYSPDASGASGPSVECFYNDGNGAGSGPGSACPPSAPIENAC
ncbi:hypothetical protein GGX14DRAFT_572083 [Mycena pura]|uniref:Secreted protein n=1 Tax=Mycena pura TaxID=153505 RepID=A0AAD6YB79_9AGAR|nr:hypothetical protein GGX14DRAFT_572083 [Mycena pura]